MSPSQTPIPPARAAALGTLQSILEGADLQAALDATLEASRMDSRDAALATELVYGTLRYKGRLDFILSLFLHRKKKVQPDLLLVMETAAYEILFLDRVPQRASVNWAVEQVKARKGKGPAGLVNAVLRRVSELNEAVHSEDFYRRRTRTPAGLLSAWYSCPPWLAELWCSAYGEKRARLLLRAGMSAPPVGLRFNWSRQEARDLYSRVAASAPLSAGGHGIGLYGPVPGELGPALEQGLVSRQSLAVQEAMQAFRPGSWSPPVWDACAGRGGKSCLLGEQGLGPIWASDSNLRRLKGLTGEQVRLGLPGILVFAARAEASPCLKSRPRTILVDAPCTGLGVLSRRPDIKWKRREADIARLAGLQSQILDQTWLLLPPGGRLVYLTCTLTPQENEQQLARLLDLHGKDRLELEWHTPFDTPLGEFLYGFSLLKD